MASQLSIISSMATKPLFDVLIEQFGQDKATGPAIVMEAIGGVHAVRRVRAGEAFDIVVLASNVIDDLMREGHIVPGSRVDLVTSIVAVAVKAGAPKVDIGSVDAVKRAVANAKSIGYSTGPSGIYLAELFGGWGMGEALKDRLVQAPPGISVGSLIADGRVELGFQQLSELRFVDGIDVLGPLPPEIQIVTTFSAGITAISTQPDAARALLEYMSSPAADQAKRDSGMEPA